MDNVCQYFFFSPHSCIIVCLIGAGTLKLMDSSEQLLWSVQVDHQLFALQKLDITVSRPA